jgi:hypothetical protein
MRIRTPTEAAKTKTPNNSWMAPFVTWGPNIQVPIPLLKTRKEFPATLRGIVSEKITIRPQDGMDIEWATRAPTARKA